MKKNKYTSLDIIYLFVLYVIAVVVVYKLPDIAAFAYFGLLLVLFWQSRKNAFWFLLIFFMVDPPGGLFPYDYNYGLPFIKGVNLRFQEVFIYVAFLKVIIKKRPPIRSVYLKAFKVLSIYLIALLIYTLALDLSISSMFITLKWLFVWSLIYSIPKLVNTFDDWVFFFRGIFIIVFIVFFSQILFLIIGQSPAYLLGTNFQPLMDHGVVDLQNFDPENYNIMEARPIGSSYIVFTGLIGALFFIKVKASYFSTWYLHLIVIVSYLSIIITATRGWFIAFSIALILFFVINYRMKRVASVIITVILVIPLVLSIPVVNKQLSGAFKRFSTIKAVTQGDVTAKGTSSRGNYSIALYELWKQNPIMGWGFSSVYKNNENTHAGLANLLLNVGIVGYLVFIYFWYKLFSVPLQTNLRLSMRNKFKGSLIAFGLGFIILFILNATSGQQFGFYLGFDMVVFGQIYFYCYSSFFIFHALKEEQLNVTQRRLTTEHQT
jgi:O-antigen ligase